MNENHPVVVELLSADYTLEESIDAVERCETYGHEMTLDTDKTLESALKYLARLTAEEDGEGELLPSTERHLSREDSQTLEELNMEWYHIHYCFCCHCCCIIIIIIIVIRESGGPPSILSDTKAEDMYLELEQLGNVLKTLSGYLEGVYNSHYSKLI